MVWGTALRSAVPTIQDPTSRAITLGGTQTPQKPRVPPSKQKDLVPKCPAVDRLRAQELDVKEANPKVTDNQRPISPQLKKAPNGWKTSVKKLKGETASRGFTEHKK